MCLNVNGVLAEKLECENSVRQCIEMYDFIFISETRTNETSSVDIDGFKSFCKHRKRRKNARMMMKTATTSKSPGRKGRLRRPQSPSKKTVLLPR